MLPGRVDCPRDSGQLQPANRHVPCFAGSMLPFHAAASAAEVSKHRSVMARGNLDITRVG